VKHSTLTEADAGRIEELLALYELPLTLPDDILTDAVMAALMHDKKFRSGQISFVLLKKLGDAYVSKDITLEGMRQAIEELRSK